MPHHERGARRPAAGLKALVVEDATSVSELIRRSLESHGFSVDSVATLEGARQRLAGGAPDVVVLDVELPDGSGFQFLREAAGSHQVPVVILTGRDAEADRVQGLELGAEDYVIKPFFPRELATRVRRAATRAQRSAPRALEFGDLTIDLAAREVTIGGGPVHLARREFDLLATLASAPRQVFSREQLLRDVWESSPEWQSTSTVTEHVRRLRQKVEDDPLQPRRIITAGGVGYRFEP